jgi:hypothetical protein
MKIRHRHLAGVVVVLAVITAASQTIDGFATIGARWARGNITMRLQLSGGSGLSDGSANFNASTSAAMDIWNGFLNRSRFVAAAGTAGRGVEGDEVNQIFFDSTYYGRSFGPEVLAITNFFIRSDTQLIEADIIFNNVFTWDSYRGSRRSNGVRDMRRVALHELGHVLGLDHPDAKGQSVTALMNSLVGDLDTLADDDIAGAQSLYGGGVTGNVTFPPRNEPNDFFNQLIAVYANELRAAPSPTYVDPEGAVIWLTEYARQRVGRCDHAAATENTIDQIVNNGGTLVCATTPTGPIPFPPRNEGLLFMNTLDATYRDALRRSLGASVVNNEGAVVWVLEYLRYRLNGCNHGDATTKVIQQIRGLGIQPVCTA